MMPTATAQYDTDGDWKYRQYDSETWEKLKLKLQDTLRPFHPCKNAEIDSIFGDPSDEWVNHLLSEAYSAISTILWHKLRLSKEQLRAEQKDVLTRLEKAEKCISEMSHDLNIMLGIEVDLLGCRDKILEIIPPVRASAGAIANLSTAKRRMEAEHEAAIEMSIRVLRILMSSKISITATAETNSGYVSDAIKIVQIIGDELGLVRDPKTWVKVIAAAKKLALDLM